MMARYCWQCSRAVADDALYCGVCGAALQTPPGQTPPGQTPPGPIPGTTYAPPAAPPGYPQLGQQGYLPAVAERVESRVGAGRWVVVGCSAIVLLSAVMPLDLGYVSSSRIWLMGNAAIYWPYLGIPALAAITISIYGKKRAQLAAFGFLLVALYASVQLVRFFGPGDFDEWLRYLPALCAAGFFALVGAICALVVGLTAKRK